MDGDDCGGVEHKSDIQNKPPAAVQVKGARRCSASRTGSTRPTTPPPPPASGPAARLPAPLPVAPHQPIQGNARSSKRANCTARTRTHARARTHHRARTRAQTASATRALARSCCSWHAPRMRATDRWPGRCHRPAERPALSGALPAMRNPPFTPSPSQPVFSAHTRSNVVVNLRLRTAAAAGAGVDGHVCELQLVPAAFAAAVVPRDPPLAGGDRGEMVGATKGCGGTLR